MLLFQGLVQPPIGEEFASEFADQQMMGAGRLDELIQTFEGSMARIEMVGDTPHLFLSSGKEGFDPAFHPFVKLEGEAMGEDVPVLNMPNGFSVITREDGTDAVVDWGISDGSMQGSLIDMTLDEIDENMFAQKLGENFYAILNGDKVSVVMEEDGQTVQKDFDLSGKIDKLGEYKVMFFKEKDGIKLLAADKKTGVRKVIDIKLIAEKMTEFMTVGKWGSDIESQMNSSGLGLLTQQVFPDTDASNFVSYERRLERETDAKGALDGAEIKRGGRVIKEKGEAWSYAKWKKELRPGHKVRFDNKDIGALKDRFDEKVAGIKNIDIIAKNKEPEEEKTSDITPSHGFGFVDENHEEELLRPPTKEEGPAIGVKEPVAQIEVGEMDFLPVNNLNNLLDLKKRPDTLYDLAVYDFRTREEYRRDRENGEFLERQNKNIDDSV